MYIFGGTDIRLGNLNNLWSLDLSTIGDLRSIQASSPGRDPNQEIIEWKRVKTHGSTPGKLSTAFIKKSRSLTVMFLLVP